MHKVVKDQKPVTTARLLADKTPLPNRIGATADIQPALKDTITENDDDFDEIEFMAPNTLSKIHCSFIFHFDYFNLLK